jgi:ribosomal protein S18 acetylase RimI-like enzyme
MYIQKVSEPTPELQEAFGRLIPQLGIHKIAPTFEEVSRLLQSDSCVLLAAREPGAGDPIAGILCLTVYRVPSGVRSIIEDVIVDEKMRRRGIGEALLRRAIDLARQAGAGGVALTSNPQREAANRLYESLGFTLRKTNSYFYPLK